MKKLLVPQYLIYRPTYRHLIVGSTGSGKTTLSSQMFRNTHFAYPDMRIIVVDPNDAYIAGGYNDRVREVFPEGITERIHGDVKGTLLNADNYKNPDKGKIVLIHSLPEALEFYHWVMENGSDLKRHFIIWDETLDSHSLGGKLIMPVRNILQKGRRRGIGTSMITQRSQRIDQTMLSETDYIYIGSLNNDRDRERIAETVAAPPEYRQLIRGYENVRGKLIKVKKRSFVFVDQENDENADYITLGIQQNGKVSR